jgi:isoleucyl-tRNA synthetase
MPYAQDHFPFEHKQDVLKCFPADFIAEGIDQTRGWFYTLMVLAVGLFDKPAFKNVIVNGIILAEDGTKMSKRLKNYPEPDAVLNRFGADALRLYLLSSPAVHAEDLSFSEKGVELILRQALIPLWNSYVFLSTYVRIYAWTPTESFTAPKADIDRWILSLTQRLIKEVTEGMDAYALNRAVEPFVGFIDQLTNWYIRRNRLRFWAEEATQDREEAFATLYTVLLRIVTVAAPFIPFLSEAIYLHLRSKEAPLSVHLCAFPQYNSEMRDEMLEEEMALVQQAVSAGHALRKEHKFKVRQPLPRAYIVSSHAAVLDALKRQKHLIMDELNVKDVLFEGKEEEFVTLLPKPNFRILGKKVGKLMNAAHKAIGQLSQRELNTLLKGNSLDIELEGQLISLAPEDVGVERCAKTGLIALTSGAITVALDTMLTDELILEGYARELINKINTMRRDNGYAVTDRIVVALKTTDKVKAALHAHRDYVMREVLCTQMHLECEEGTLWDINGEPTTIAISLSVVQRS